MYKIISKYKIKTIKNLLRNILLKTNVLKYL